VAPFTIPDGQVFTQPWRAGPNDQRRDQTIYYQYRADRARAHPTRHRRTSRQGREGAVAGKVAVKRNRFIKLTGATKSVNRQMEAKTRALAGLKGYADVAVMPRIGWSVLVMPGCGAAASA
jgi:hypothetical protein